MKNNKTTYKHTNWVFVTAFRGLYKGGHTLVYRCSNIVYAFYFNTQLKQESQELQM